MFFQGFFFFFFLVPRGEQTCEGVISKMSEKRQIQKKSEWLANVRKKKSGAKHEIQGACPHSEQNGQRRGVSACVYVRACARMCVFVCVHSWYLATTKLNWEGRGNKTQRSPGRVARWGISIYQQAWGASGWCVTSSSHLFRSFEGPGWHPYSLVNRTGWDQTADLNYRFRLKENYTVPLSVSEGAAVLASSHTSVLINHCSAQLRKHTRATTFLGRVLLVGEGLKRLRTVGLGQLQMTWEPHDTQAHTYRYTQ